MINSNFTQIVAPVFKQVSDDQIQEIHFASLEILERTGVRMHLQEAIDLLKIAGAHVSDGNLVRIPSHLTEKALVTAPKRVVLCDREGSRVMPLEGRKSYFGTGSDCLNILDHRTDTRRKAKLSDVVDAIKVCEYLENIDFVMSTFLPWDVPNTLVDRYQMEVMLNYTRKPIVAVSLDIEGLRDCVEMAEAVAGGADALRQNPFIANYVNLTSDLLHNKESLEQLMYFAEKGLPTTYTPNGNRGAMAPITAAGAVAHIGAGNIVGLILSQLKREGTPFIWGGWGLLMDMKTQVIPYAPPDVLGFPAAHAKYLGLPYFGLSGCSDSKVLDGQATLEAALTLMGDVLTGANLIHDVGYLESGLMGSLELLVICDEIIGWVKRFMDPIEVNRETLALDVIDEVGPEGHFLSSEHTLEHFKKDWYPNLLDRQNYEAWRASGSTTLQTRAKAKVEEIVNSPRNKVLPADIRQKVNAILKRAEAHLG